MAILTYQIYPTLHWRHNERDGVSSIGPAIAKMQLFEHDQSQRFVQAQIKENIKAPYQWPLWGEITGHPHKVPVTRRMFPFDDVTMWLYFC